MQCDKKTMQAHFASVIQELDARMGDLSMRIGNGYECASSIASCICPRRNRE